MLGEIMSSITKILGTKIRALRNRRGLTQAELAEKADLTPEHLSKLENGHVEGVEYATVVRLAKVFGIKTSLLADEEITVEAIKTLDIVAEALEVQKGMYGKKNKSIK